MGIEYDYILGSNKDEMIKKLESRGLDYNEACRVADIVFNAERYKTKSFTVKAKLEALRDLLKRGMTTMENIGGKPGPFYSELIKMIKELEGENI